MTLLCAGEAFEDLVFYQLDRLPDLGEEVRTDHFTATLGGGAIVTAIHAARLGIKSSVISALGDAAVAQLKRERVSVTNLRKPKEPHAITAAMATDEDRAFVTFNGVNPKLEARIATALPKAVANHVHLCFYPHDCAQWTRIVMRLRKRGITTSWDLGWTEPLSDERGLTGLIDALDFVFVSELGARLNTGEGTLEGAIPHWRQRQAITIIKQGQNGATWLAPNSDIHFPAPRAKAADSSSASDAFNAGFLAAWLQGKSPAQCLASGNKASASLHGGRGL